MDVEPDNFGHAVVYVKFRDEEGSESETYHAEVDLRQPSELGVSTCGLAG